MIVRAQRQPLRPGSPCPLLFVKDGGNSFGHHVKPPPHDRILPCAAMYFLRTFVSSLFNGGAPPHPLTMPLTNRTRTKIYWPQKNRSVHLSVHPPIRSFLGAFLVRVVVHTYAGVGSAGKRLGARPFHRERFGFFCRKLSGGPQRPMFIWWRNGLISSITRKSYRQQFGRSGAGHKLSLALVAGCVKRMANRFRTSPLWSNIFFFSLSKVKGVARMKVSKRWTLQCVFLQRTSVVGARQGLARKAPAAKRARA